MEWGGAGGGVVTKSGRVVDCREGAGAKFSRKAGKGGGVTVCLT